MFNLNGDLSPSIFWLRRKHYRLPVIRKLLAPSSERLLDKIISVILWGKSSFIADAIKAASPLVQSRQERKDAGIAVMDIGAVWKLVGKSQSLNFQKFVILRAEPMWRW